MKRVIDARGLACPKPVVLTKRELERTGQLITIVDNMVAVENVKRLAKSKGCTVEVEDRDGDYHLLISCTDESSATVSQDHGNVVVLIASKHFGEGDQELGKILMNSFIYTLNQIDNISHLIFMNSGVFLTLEDSEVLEMLKNEEDNGVEILSCGTCLDFYGVKEQLAVGKVTNMYTATEVLASATNTITI